MPTTETKLEVAKVALRAIAEAKLDPRNTDYMQICAIWQAVARITLERIDFPQNF